MKRLAWVLGDGGRLGSALARRLLAEGSELYRFDRRFRWSDLNDTDAAFAIAAAEFDKRSREADRWEIYWAAGVGHMGCTADSMRGEEQLLDCLLARLADQPTLLDGRGGLAFLSSAGAIYDGSTAAVIDEHSPVAPTTAYGASKLRQEALLEGSSFARSGNQILLARVTTVYGPSPNPSSRHGLVTEIARRMLRNQPMRIWVPLDTVRDFLEVDDAARVTIDAIRADHALERVRRKIVASECPATVAEVLGIFSRLAHQRLPFISGISPVVSAYANRFRFRSVVSPDSRRLIRHSLATGLASLLAWEQTRMTGAPGREELRS